MVIALERGWCISNSHIMERAFLLAKMVCERLSSLTLNGGWFRDCCWPSSIVTSSTAAFTMFVKAGRESNEHYVLHSSSAYLEGSLLS